MPDKTPINIQKAIDASTTEASLKDLQQKGFSKVKVLDERAIRDLISHAIDRVVSTQTTEEKERLLADSRREFDRLMKEQREMKSRSQLLEADKNEVIERVEALQKELTLTLDLQQETIRKKIQESTGALQQKADESMRRNAAAQQELAAARVEVESLQEENVKLQEEIELSRTTGAEIRQDITNQSKKTQALEKTSADSQSRAGKAEAELARVRAEAAKLEPELARLRDEVKKRASEISSFRDELAGVPQKLKEAAEKERASLQWQTKEAQEKMDGAVKLQRQAKEDYDRQNAATIRLSGEIQNSKNLAKKLEEELSKTKEDLAAAQKAAAERSTQGPSWKYAVVKQPAGKSEIEIPGGGAWELVAVAREPDGSCLCFFKAPK